MKYIYLFTAFFMIQISGIYAQQRYGFVDTKYILERVPDYQKAQQQLDEFSVKWQIEIETVRSEIEDMKEKFREEELFLSIDMKEKREEEIYKKEILAQKMQQKYFGPNGELYQKRQELVRPIQDDIYEAIKEIAKFGNYGMIIDRAYEPTIIYCDIKFDLSEKVLHKLGIRTK